MRVGEPVRVGAVFGPGATIRPVWFDRRGRQHRVREVTYRWRERQGAATALHFTVTVVGEGTLYELAYDTAEQTWTLAALEPEGR
jgi:hypothetical protein